VRLIAGRRRNQAGLAVLAAVPVVIAIAVRLAQPRPGRGPDFISQITGNGLFVALAALTIEIVMMLPIAVSMLSGDAIAGEANQGTLRYLLTVPVSRTRLVLLKYASLCFAALWGTVLVALTGVLVGLAIFGSGTMTTLSGTQLSFWAALGRLGLVVLYLAATIAVMIFTILSWVLDAVPQLSWLHPWLIVHEWTSFGDLLRDPVALDAGTGAGRGLLVALGYAVVFVSAAWARLSSKDVTS
jgi:ABC-2 type transport system permease protein